MAVYSGFFNAVGHDRQYNAVHFSWFFDGLIHDGVYANWPYSDDPQNPIADTDKGMYVSAGTGRSVNVAVGRAWFNRVWIYNDSVLNLSIDNPQTSLVQRIDAIIIDVDAGDDARKAEIKVLKGNEASNPDKPTLINSGTRHQYALAYVRVIYGEEISNQNIEHCVGGETPCVEALLDLSSEYKTWINGQLAQVNNPEFTEAQTLTNINSGESSSTLWGKVKKFFTTLLFNPGTANAGKIWKVGSNGQASWQDNVGVVTRNGPGLAPTLPSNGTGNKYLADDGTWSAPSSTVANAETVNGVEVTYNNGYGYWDESVSPRVFKFFRQPTKRDPQATASKVLSGYYFANGTSDEIEGSMVNRGGISRSLNCGGSYVGGPGYYSSVQVSANSLSSQTSATASDSDIISGKTAWVNGSRIYGSLTDMAAYEDYKSCGSDSNYLYVRIPKGAYRTTGSIGWPEIKVPIRNNPSYDVGNREGKEAQYSETTYITLPSGSASVKFWAKHITGITVTTKASGVLSLYAFYYNGTTSIGGQTLNQESTLVIPSNATWIEINISTGSNSSYACIEVYRRYTDAR